MNFHITILGSGAALPIGSRSCSAQYISVNGHKILIDCAEGTQSRIRRNHIRMQSISTILISHLHGDHFFGLPGLLSSMHLCGRSEPIDIIAPRGAREVIETTFALTGNHIDFCINWSELDFDEGERCVLQNNRCTIYAFPLVHTVPTYGFRILPKATAADDNVCYTYCCDTAYDERLLDHIANSTLLCIESTFTDKYEPLATKCLHLTTTQAARLAYAASVHHLLLTHISARFREPEPLLEEAFVHFQQTTIAADNMHIEVRSKDNIIITQPYRN